MSSNNQNNNQPTGGTFRIGGPHKCNIHEPFETFDDVNKWNEHCLQHPNDHYIYGTKKCEDCDTILALNKVPYNKITANGLDLKVRCSSCHTKSQGQLKAIQEGHIVELNKKQQQQ